MANDLFSLRDLRSAIIREKLSRDLQGSFDGLSRRWTFASRLARDEGRAACNALPFIVKTYYDSRDHVQTIRKHGGFDVIGQHENGGIRSPHRTVVFANQEDRLATEQALFRLMRAGDDRVARIVQDAGTIADEFLALPEHRQALTRLRAGLAWKHDADAVAARVSAVRSAAAPSDAARRTSVASAVDTARQFFPDFDPTTTEPRDGSFYGIVVARSDHHLALRDNRGTDVLLERARLCLPISQRTKSELLPLYNASLHVRFENGVGRTVQSRERDPDLGAVLVCMMRKASDLDVLDILHHEEYDAKHDIDGDYIVASSYVAGVVDNGATAIIGTTKDFEPNERGRVTRDHAQAAAQRPGFSRR